MEPKPQDLTAAGVGCGAALAVVLAACIAVLAVVGTVAAVRALL